MYDQEALKQKAEALVQQSSELAEDIAALHERDHGLPAIDRPLGDGDAARGNDAQEAGLVTLAEHDVAPEEALRLGRRRHARHLVVSELIEEFHVLEQTDVDHAGIVPTPEPWAGPTAVS